MTLIALSRGDVIPGTFFWGSNDNMERFSQINSGNDRPHLVISVNNGMAKCFPLSSSSDAWNATISPHYIPYDFNPKLFRNTDSLYAVNRPVRDGRYPLFPVSYIHQKDRIDLPLEFVSMGLQLEDAFRADYQQGRIRRPTRTRFKDNRVQQAVRRVELTTSQIMHDIYPALTGF